jgi:transposase
MITVDTIGRVRRANFVRGHKIKAIARDLKIARNTVRDIVRAGEASGVTERRYLRMVQPLPRLWAHAESLEQMLRDNAKRGKRERLTYSSFSLR